MKNIYRLSFILLFALVTIILSCNTTEPTPPGNEAITLSLEETTCTEAWIELKTNGLTFPANINLLKDNSVAHTISLNSNDTTIYLDSLSPSKSYQFQAKLGQVIIPVSSSKLTIQTLDTTSHNFTPQTFTFGDPSVGSSHFNDVAVIDENNIWAVGEIYMNDSTGQPDLLPYNLAMWDGNKWNLIKAPFYYQGKAFYSPLNSIYAFNANDIWLEAGIHWDGNQFQTEPLNIDFPSHVNKMWGTSSSNLYIVGNNGLIAHRNSNGRWSKIESGTTTIIRDIWGARNPADNSSIVYCAVSNILSPGDHKILRINNNNTVSEKYWGYNYIISSIWFKSINKMYACGDLIAENNNSSQWIFNNSISLVGTLRTRGTDYNNVFVVGSYGFAAHFNGVSWGLLRPLNYGAEVYYSCDAKSGIMCAVGEKDAQGMITIFR